MKTKIILLTFMLALPFICTKGQDTLVTQSFHSGIPNLVVTDVPIVRDTYGGTKIVPTFYGDWDSDQKEAFITACRLWEEVLPTSFPIKIKVREQLVNSNIATNSVLSETYVQSIHDSVSYYVGEPFAPLLLNVQAKGVLYMIMTGQAEGEVEDIVENSSLFVEDEMEIVYYHYANKGLNDIFSFSIDASSVPSDKYDFVTFAMRDIAKGLGIGWYFPARNGRLNINPNKATAFEKYILRQLPSDKQLAYNAATQGSLYVYGEQNTGYQLYAPTTWSDNVSLNYFYPNNNIKITKLLDWNYGTGEVMRDIIDENTNKIFSDLLGWNGLIGVGIDDEIINSTEYGANTGNAVPYHGNITFYGSGSRNHNTGRVPVNMIQEITQNRDIDTPNVYKYHPNYLPNGSISDNNRSLALLRNNGEWDVIYSDYYTIEGEDIDVSYNDLQIHYPDSAYARTYDGKLRGRYTYYSGVGPHTSNMIVNYFVLNDLPQTVEMIPSQCRFLPEYDQYYDEFTGVIRIPIGKTAGTTRIVVAQYDDGDTVPYYYEVPNVKDNFFTAVVDREYETTFVLTAYNSNGNTQSTYVYTPPVAPNGINMQFIRDNNVIKITHRSRKTKNECPISSATITDVIGNKPLIDLTFENNEIDISALPKGNYILNVIDIKGFAHAYKFSR